MIMQPVWDIDTVELLGQRARCKWAFYLVQKEVAHKSRENTLKYFI